ncbi:unnamed protein product [Musa acuminata var. zebrina]
MRLADFLQCSCGAQWPEKALPETRAAGAPIGLPAAPREERRRRRRRVGEAGNDATTTWRPSLAAISENCSAAARDGKTTAGGAAKAKGGVSRRVFPRANSDDHRYKDVSSVVPAFVPAAYLF